MRPAACAVMAKSWATRRLALLPGDTKAGMLNAQQKPATVTGRSMERQG